MKNKAPSAEIQAKALTHVAKVYSEYKNLLTTYRAKWLEYFQDTYVFEEKKRKGAGQSKIFFPKAYEQVEKVAPRIFGSRPKYVISLNTPINPNDPTMDMLRSAQANQAALNYFWKIGKNSKKTRTATKAMLVYGTVFLKAKLCRKTTKVKREEVIGGAEEGGEEMIRTTEVETVIQEYPTFTVPDIFDLYFDPRVECVEDMLGIVEVTDNVRLAELIQHKEFFNIDQLKSVEVPAYDSSGDNNKLTKFSLQGVPVNMDIEGSVSYKTYYGYFSETGEPEDERLYQITTTNNDTVIIGYKELEFSPYVKINATEIPNQGTGVGLVQPIKKLQEAYNLTRNQRFENVSLVINRMWLMKQGAGIDPRKLRSIAGNIIPVKDLNDLAPVPTPDVTGSAFSEAQSLNTEIQTTLGTIDTTQDNSGNGFTNLATGQKIRWNEFNVRFKAIKENLEEGLAEAGEKMLRIYANEATMNPLVEDEVTGAFYEIAKTVFDSSGDFYKVSILADSTSLDSTENKREEALGFGQVALAYKGQGVPVPLTKVWMDIVASYPGKNPDEYLEAAPPPQEGGGKGSPIPEGAVEGAQVQQNPEDELNQQLTNVA